MRLKSHSLRRIGLILLLALLSGAGTGLLSRHFFSENARFESFTGSLFRQELSGNTLNLHYTLAHPEAYGISGGPVTLGRAAPSPAQEEALLASIQSLESFSYARLDRENRLTLDMLLLYFKTELSLGGDYLLEEVLSPGLGIQAQLPVLLAEYPFYDRQDIDDYLQLLSCVGPYFDDILEYEAQKAEAGLFMSDTTLQRILEQCRGFLDSGEENYLSALFREKLEGFQGLTDDERRVYQEQQDTLLQEEVFPAYQALIQGLSRLEGSGRNPYGLCYFSGGRDYYQYLIRSQTGVYSSVEDLRDRMLRQLLADSEEMNALLRKDSRLAEQCLEDLADFRPADALEALEEAYPEDFPVLKELSYEVRYVPASLEEFSSPAFYLVPPLDTGSPNTIYINRSSQTSNLELFTTLAHEGFPGHLYQTNYFYQSSPSDIRHLFRFSGYVEGWATYVESYAYGYSGLDTDTARLCWLNRSLNLCLCSLLDIGIHYYGWTPAEAGSFLAGFGITDGTAINEIFQYIVETPGNYLKYYLGYLGFADLREEAQKKEGAQFSLKAFHEKVLDIGPVQFPVLKKYLLEDAA